MHLPCSLLTFRSLALRKQTAAKSITQERAFPNDTTAVLRNCLGWCHATNPAPILGVEDRPAMATASADVDRLQRRLASGGRGMDLPSNILVDLSRVMRALYRLQGELTAAEKQPFEASSQPRLRKIKQNVYDVEDILDELEDGSCSSSRGRKFAGASYLCSQVSSMDEFRLIISI